MAVPYVQPDEDGQEAAQGQQLEQLMLALYMALQQVLRSRSARHRNREFTAFLRLVHYQLLYFLDSLEDFIFYDYPL